MRVEQNERTRGANDLCRGLGSRSCEATPQPQRQCSLPPLVPRFVRELTTPTCSTYFYVIQSPDRPPSPPKILHPSPSYLALIPSTPLQNACIQCKLLILDLNGTLLITYRKDSVHLLHRPIDSDGRHQQGEGTKAWLDVMSSAQPHNVGNTIEKWKIVIQPGPDLSQ